MARAAMEAPGPLMQAAWMAEAASRTARRREIEQRIHDIASSQHGVVTRAQLLELGIPERTIAHRVQAGRLAPLHRGVYGLGSFLPPKAMIMAATLACGPHAVLSHRSAAALYDLIVGPPEQPNVTAPRPFTRTRPGIRVWRVRTLHADETTRREGIPVTAPLRTLVDLCFELNEHQLERIVARAERERLVTQAELGAALARYGGRPGFRRFRAVLGRIGGPSFTRSEAEARFLQLVRRARLPAPQANVRVGGYEIDFFWPDLDLAVEVDGYRYHGSRDRFESDRRRASGLAALGIHVIGVTWRQIMEDDVATAIELGQIIARRQTVKRHIPTQSVADARRGRD